MQKICIITTVHQVLDVRIFYKQAKSLLEAGYDVTLIAQNETNKTIDGIKVIGLRKPKNRFQRVFGLSYAAFGKARAHDYDIYHIHDPELLFVGILLKLVTGKKIIYDVHEDYPRSIQSKYWIPWYLRSLISVAMAFAEQLSSYFMDAIIPVTDTIENRFKRKKTIQIRNYPLLDYKFSIIPTMQPRRKIRLLYIGGVSRERGIFEIIDSLKYVDNKCQVEFIIMGKIEHQEAEEYIREHENLGVVYKGFQNRDEVKKSLVESDIGIVCLHPNGRYEYALPVKLFEYMAAGLPVIASNFDSWRPYIEENECGVLVNPLRPEDIANAIEKLAYDYELRIRMGQQGRQAVLDKYNWDNEKNKLLNLYKELLNG